MEPIKGLLARVPHRRLSTRSTGIVLAFATALISGIAVYLNAFGVRTVPDPAIYTTLKNGVAAAMLAGLLLAAPAARGSARRLGRRDGAWLLVIGVVGGSVPFVLFFTGLAQASAPTAAFIHKTLFVWVALLAVPLLGERLGALQIGALGALAAGQLLLAPPAGVQWGIGETLIAAATILWAIEVVIARRLLAAVPSRVVGAARMGLGLLVLAGFLLVTGRLPALASVPAAGWIWVVVSGALLAGYVATWFAALQRAPATVVTSILVLGAPVTAGLQAVATGRVPDVTTVLGAGLIVGAVASMAVLARVAAASRPRPVSGTA